MTITLCLLIFLMASALIHMAAIVGIISNHGLRVEVHHRNQPNKSKLALLKL